MKNFFIVMFANARDPNQWLESNDTVLLPNSIIAIRQRSNERTTNDYED